jgi:uncharacterized OsmC-like protein
VKPDFDWSVRVRSIDADGSKAYARNHAFSVGRQASLKESDAHPSATEYLLGALAGDLLDGFRRAVARRGIAIDAMEALVSGRLDNVLVHLGVIGETGSPGFKTIDVTVYATADAEDEMMRALWEEALAHSPIYNTLKQAAEVRLNLRLP